MTDPFRLLMTADTIGGVWSYCMELAAALASHGVEIALVTMGALPTQAQRSEIALLPHVTLFTSDYKLEWMDDAWQEVDEAGDWLLAVAKEFQPHVVHLNGYVHSALPWEAPVLIVAHSCVLTWWDAVKGKSAPSSWVEYKQRVSCGLRQADLVVSPTRAMLSALAEHYAFVTPQCVIPNCRQRDLFPPAAKEPIIFSSGRLWDEGKNTQLLEKIAPRLAWPVHLAGAMRGPTSSIQEPGRNSNAILLGNLRCSELARHLSTASIYAAPARYEPFGLGILEAALAGCALVLSDLPSLRENWEGAAMFVPSYEPEAWIQALNGLAALPKSIHLLAAQAHDRARKFLPEQTATAYRRAYESLRAKRQEHSLATCST